jgi:hypothetical protein
MNEQVFKAMVEALVRLKDENKAMKQELEQLRSDVEQLQLVKIHLLKQINALTSS